MQESKVKKKSSQPDLLRAAVLHASVLNGVQGKRLGQSYGFDVIKFKTSSIEEDEEKEEIDKTVKVLESVAGPVDAIDCRPLWDRPK